MNKLRTLGFIALLLVGVGVGSYNGLSKKYGYAPVTSTPWYQNGFTTVFTGPISVPSCTGCGGGGGSSDMPFFTQGTNVYLTTSTNKVLIGSANTEPDAPFTVASGTPNTKGQIQIDNYNTSGVAAIQFTAAASSTAPSEGVGFLGVSGSTTEDFPPNLFLIGNTNSNGNGVAIVADGNGPGVQIDNTNNMTVKGQILSDYHGDFSHASFGWDDSPGDGLALVGAGKPLMIAGGGYVMTWSQADIESLVNLNPYSPGVQGLGQDNDPWGNVYTVNAFATNVSTTSMIASGSVSAGGGSSGHATCWKTDGKTIGYCSTIVDASGLCTCN